MGADSDSADEGDVPQTPSEQEMSPSELVRSFLTQVRTEFTAWNIAHRRQILTSFTAPSTWRSCLHPDLRSPDLSFNSLPDGFQPTILEPNCLSSLVSQEVYSPDGAVTETTSVKLEVIHVTSSVEPHPLYESCSPLHHNLFKGDDSDNMDFIPYADDHTFDQTSHTHHYGSFSWQDIFDPDLEVIVLETAYRLQTQRGLTYDEIESCNVLPLKLHSQPGKTGVLSTFRRRDHLRWTGNTIPAVPFLPPSTWSERFGLRSRLKSLNSFFCPNINCVEPLCSVHVEPNPMPVKSRPPFPDTPVEVTNPCRNQCFINKIEVVSPSWDEADLDTFTAIFEILPDATPCDLAALCLKPCNEVLYYRKLLFPTCSSSAQPSEAKSQRRLPRFNDNNPTQFTPNDPCHHTGPCNNSSGCPCAKNQSHCQRNCCCSLECNRRWQGCRCLRTKSRWNCVTERCPCVEALRECDPELCVNCRCIGKLEPFCFKIMFFLGTLADDTSCRNSQIQRGARKELEVKKSSWGLGSFLVEPAKAGDLITEYIGELIYEPTVESRGDLAVHRDRCYVFDLNKTFSLDSTYAGNISRFIDHSDAERGKRVNCRAQVRLVNGDHRIGIFAIRDMEAGSQILMNYGPMFFAE